MLIASSALMAAQDQNLKLGIYYKASDVKRINIRYNTSEKKNIKQSLKISNAGNYLLAIGDLPVDTETLLISFSGSKNTQLELKRIQINYDKDSIIFKGLKMYGEFGFNNLELIAIDDQTLITKIGRSKQGGALISLKQNGIKRIEALVDSNKYLQTKVTLILKTEKPIMIHFYYLDGNEQNFVSNHRADMFARSSGNFQIIERILFHKNDLIQTRIDLGDVPDNEITLKQIILETQDSVKIVWDSNDILNYFWINEYLEKKEITSEYISFKSKTVNSKVDPYISLNKYGKLRLNFLQKKLEPKKLFLDVASDNLDFLLVRYWDEDKNFSGKTIVNYMPNSNNSFKELAIDLFTPYNIDYLLLMLGNKPGVKVNLRSIRYSDENLTRSWHGEKILKYFEIKLLNVIEQNPKSITLNTVSIQDKDIIYPTITLKSKLISIKKENTLLRQKIFTFLLIAIFFFYINKIVAQKTEDINSINSQKENVLKIKNSLEKVRT